MAQRDRDEADALRQAAEIGPFFALSLDPPGHGWIAFADFAGDPDSVATAVAQARRRLAATAVVDESAVEWRAAASIWHLGVVARVVSPALGAAVVAGWCPRLDRVRWPSDQAPSPLAVRTDELDGTAVSGAAAAADALEASVVDPVLAPLTRTVAAVGSVSDHVLWGNVWSAFAGAAAMIANVRPASGGDALAIVRALVETRDRPVPGRYLWAISPRNLLSVLPAAPRRSLRRLRSAPDAVGPAGSSLTTRSLPAALVDTLDP